jgi:hypothetical protein
VTEAGETPKSADTPATTEAAPPQSGAMAADQVAGEDAPEAPTESVAPAGSDAESTDSSAADAPQAAAEEQTPKDGDA